MMKKTDFIVFTIISLVACCAYSLIIHFFFNAYKTYHWYYSVMFFQLMFTFLFIFRKSANDPRTDISNVMSASIGRLLFSAVAFLIYGQLFPFGQNAMVVHFIPHYFIFAGTELYFLLKLAKNNSGRTL